MNELPELIDVARNASDDWKLNELLTPQNILHLTTFTPSKVLDLLVRLEIAEAWTKEYACKIVYEKPYDFQWCETHDRTFALDSTCDHKGLSAVDWVHKRENEQRFRAIQAEEALEEVLEALQRVRKLADDIEKTKEFGSPLLSEAIADSIRLALGDIDEKS